MGKIQRLHIVTHTCMHARMHTHTHSKMCILYWSMHAHIFVQNVHPLTLTHFLSLAVIGYVAVHYTQHKFHIYTSWMKLIRGEKGEAKTARRERGGKHTASRQLVADLNSTAEECVWQWCARAVWPLPLLWVWCSPWAAESAWVHTSAEWHTLHQWVGRGHGEGGGLADGHMESDCAGISDLQRHWRLSSRQIINEMVVSHFHLQSYVHFFSVWSLLILTLITLAITISVASILTPQPKLTHLTDIRLLQWSCNLFSNMTKS